MPSQNLIDILRKKLSEYESELAIASDPEKKFLLKHEIEGLRSRLTDLEQQDQSGTTTGLGSREWNLDRGRTKPALLAALTICLLGILCYAISQHQALSQSEEANSKLQGDLLDARQSLPSVDLQNAIKTMNEIGILNIWAGSFSQAENQRLTSLIQNATTIKFISYNGNKIFDTIRPGFGQDFQQFLHRDGTSMQVLLANPKDDFYLQNSILAVPLGSSPLLNQTDFVKQQAESMVWLKGYARDPSQVSIRFFSNQMRLPLFIFDDDHCIMTIRLTGSPSTVRIEFGTAASGYIATCIEHFNKVWNAAIPATIGGP